MWSWLEGFGPDLSGADPHAPVDVDGPDLAVADLPGTGRGGDDVDHLVHVGRLDEHLDLDLGDEADLVLAPSERLGLAALTPVALHLRDRHADDPGSSEGVLDLLQLERFHNRCNEVNHAVSLVLNGFFVGPDGCLHWDVGTAQRLPGTKQGRVAHALAELHVIGGRAVLVDVHALELTVVVQTEVPGSADGLDHGERDQGEPSNADDASETADRLGPEL